MRIRIASKYINQRKYLLQENRRHWCIHEGIYSHLNKICAGKCTQNGQFISHLRSCNYLGMLG